MDNITKILTDKCTDVVTQRDITELKRRVRQIVNAIDTMSDSNIKSLLNNLVILKNFMKDFDVSVVLEACSRHTQWSRLYSILKVLGVYTDPIDHCEETLKFLSGWLQENKNYEKVFRDSRRR